MSRVYFTDRDLGRAFPEILAESGLTVERHCDHFAPETPDEEWLRVIGERGWVAVSRDTRIRYRPNEFAAVLRHRVALLIVVGKAAHAELARNLAETIRRIEAVLSDQPPPLIMKIYRPSPAELARNPRAPGTVSLWYPTEPRAPRR